MNNQAKETTELSQILEYIKRLERDRESDRRRIEELEGKTSSHSIAIRNQQAVLPEGPRTDPSDISNLRALFDLTHERTIPEVRECNFADFKNRFEPNGEDGCYAVDVLVSGSLLQQEIQEEHKIRDKLFLSKGAQPTTRTGKPKKNLAVMAAQKASDDINRAQGEETWPRRIRIQAPALLRILARVQNERWSDRPRTYFRPFNPLIYHHPKMKAALEELEKTWGAKLDEELRLGTASWLQDNHHEAKPRAGTEVEFDAGGDADSVNDEDGREGYVENSTKTLAILRAYVKYMDEKIIPDYRRFEDLDENSNVKVRFSDLWYLFRTGELVYRLAEGDVPDHRDFRVGKRIWKSYFVKPCPERLEETASDSQGSEESAASDKDKTFVVGAYYLEYTGEEFCIVEHEFEIPWYPGERLVSTLPIMPVRFCFNHRDRIEHARESGEDLISFIEMKHCRYNGWTLNRAPDGGPALDVTGKPIQHPEYVNSEVMVDFGEAFQQCPMWRPKRTLLRPQGEAQGTDTSEFSIRWWSDRQRTQLRGETFEVIPVRTGVTTKQRNAFVQNDRLLNIISDNAKRGDHTTKADLEDEAKVLLTGRVYAYVFQERKFSQLSVLNLKPSARTTDALDSLMISKKHKMTIQGSVQGHFLQKKAEREIDIDWLSLDLIQGKGTGLFILLHGHPGVGKTATAEAVAQANGKPLFKITVGDLGMTPERVEESLREIFRLASIWDCILLLDEVDTFFSMRSVQDTAITKNALVAVFLRVLDYYNGILFLTTNRPGTLDEAFQSRIHHKIYYPPLTLQQTLAIWKLNIERVRKIEGELAVSIKGHVPMQVNEEALLDFAQKQFKHGKLGRWNGREIRNAFQVVRSMAYYEHSLNPKKPLTLDVRHFETADDISIDFAKFFASIHHGKNPSDLARENLERNDYFKAAHSSYDTEPPHGRNRSNSTRQQPARHGAGQAPTSQQYPTIPEGHHLQVNQTRARTLSNVSHVSGRPSAAQLGLQQDAETGGGGGYPPGRQDMRGSSPFPPYGRNQSNDWRDNRGGTTAEEAREAYWRRKNNANNTSSSINLPTARSQVASPTGGLGGNPFDEDDAVAGVGEWVGDVDHRREFTAHGRHPSLQSQHRPDSRGHSSLRSQHRQGSRDQGRGGPEYYNRDEHPADNGGRRPPLQHPQGDRQWSGPGGGGNRSGQYGHDNHFNRSRNDQREYADHGYYDENEDDYGDGFGGPRRMGPARFSRERNKMQEETDLPPLDNSD